MKYEKTEDPNIIKQTKEVVSEIYINILEKQVENLETQITNFSEKIVEYPKDVTDEIKKTIDFYNQMCFPDSKERMEEKLQKKKEFLMMLKGL